MGRASSLVAHVQSRGISASASLLLRLTPGSEEKRYNAVTEPCTYVEAGYFNSARAKPHSLTKMAVAWDRLIRFVATDGRILRGEPILPSPDFDLGNTTAETQLKARVISGNDLYDTSGITKVTDELVTVRELLGPLAQADVPILRCVGLNYAKHSKYVISRWLTGRC